MKKRLIKERSITPVLRDVMVVIGIAMIFIGVRYLSGWSFYVCAVAGLLLGAIGAYSGRAALFGLRPFGESPWRRAKRTYEEADSHKE